MTIDVYPRQPIHTTVAAGAVVAVGSAVGAAGLIYVMSEGLQPEGKMALKFAIAFLAAPLTLALTGLAVAATIAVATALAQGKGELDITRLQLPGSTPTPTTTSTQPLPTVTTPTTTSDFAR